MAAKTIKFDSEAREAIRRGVSKLAKAVRTTLVSSARFRLSAIRTERDPCCGLTFRLESLE